LQLPFVVLILLIVQFVLHELQYLEVVGLLEPHLLQVGCQFTLILEQLLPALVDLLSLLVDPVLHQILVGGVLLRLQDVVIGVHVVAALEGVGVDDSQLFVEDHPCAALFADVFVPVLGLHVLSRKDALFELKVDAVLGEHLRVELTLHLLDELVDGVAEDEVAFEGGVGMQVQVHEQSFVFGVVLAKFFDCETGGLLLGVWSAVVAVEVLVECVHPAVPP